MTAFGASREVLEAFGIAKNAQEAPKPPMLCVSPLDKHAHLRRTVDSHHQSLQVHQVVLQKHAELHGVQAKAREALRKELRDEILAASDGLINGLVGRIPARRGFVGRLRWLFTGR